MAGKQIVTVPGLLPGLLFVAGEPGADPAAGESAAVEG